MAQSLEAQQAEYEEIPIPDTEEEWLAARKPWWNSSLAACLFGEHKYVSLGDACTEKLRTDFKVIDEDTAKMFRRGVDLEPFVAKEVADLTGLVLYRPSVMYRRGIMLTTLDFEVASDDARHVEIKTTTLDLQGQIPRYWYWQAQAQMWCRDTVTTIIGALEGRRLQVSLFEVDRDEDAIRRMIDKAEEMMQAIRFGDLPPGVELSAENVAVLYPRDTGTSVDLPPEVAVAVAKYDEARAEEKHWKEEKERQRDFVVTRMGDAAFATVNGVQLASYKTSKDQEAVDWDRLAADHPELVAKYRYQKPGSRRFIIRPSALKSLENGDPHADF